MRIVIDYKLDNWNNTIAHCRGNKYGANFHKKKEMKDISVFFNGIKPVEKYPIKIDCEWHVKNINSDLDNKSLKAVLDEMQILGILENDNIKHIPEINHKAIKDTKEYLILNIEEIIDK